MAAPPPAVDDQPATRRDLAQLRELLVSMMQAQAAELRQDMANLRTEVADRSVSQIRWLVGALSVWGVILAGLDRLP